MKVWIYGLVLFLAVAAAAVAGEITVEVKTAKGEPRAGARVELALEDGEVTDPVKTGSNGVARLQWKSKAKRGRIKVDGSTVYSGSIPLRISFSL